MTDLIDRQAVLDAVDRRIQQLMEHEPFAKRNIYAPRDLYGIKAFIQDLPSAQNTGEWNKEEEYGDLWVCDQCGFANEYKDNYCPNCGAKMKGA